MIQPNNLLAFSSRSDFRVDNDDFSFARRFNWIRSIPRQSACYTSALNSSGRIALLREFGSVEHRHWHNMSRMWSRPYSARNDKSSWSTREIGSEVLMPTTAIHMVEERLVWIAQEGPFLVLFLSSHLRRRQQFFFSVDMRHCCLVYFLPSALFLKLPIMCMTGKSCPVQHVLEGRGLARSGEENTWTVVDIFLNP